MSYDLHDTICAIATASGGAARGMVRVSGPDALPIVSHIFRASDNTPLDSLMQSTALHGSITIELPTCTQELPCDAFIWPTKRSYTRQPIAELHTLGSPPLLEAILSAVCRAGARIAEPGEFTMRAFLAGRIDLTQAEAVLGVIDARGDDDLKAALAQLAGGLARPLQHVRDELLQLLAELEAGLDFVDEDIEFVSSDESLARLISVGKTLTSVTEQTANRSTAGSAAQVVLLGSPNVGKSSLFNALVARHGIRRESRPQPSQALVSAECGTTRDYLNATLDLGGARFELVDTAGIENSFTGDAGCSSARHAEGRFEIDMAAQALAIERRDTAAIRLCCVEASLEETRASLCQPECDIVVMTKSDLVSRSPECADGRWNVPVVATSSQTGAGLDTLMDAIHELLLNEESARPGLFVGTTADRCRESVRLAEQAIERARYVVIENGGNELVAAELRTALSELGKVVGAVYTDDLLDRIFSTFCIGK